MLSISDQREFLCFFLYRRRFRLQRQFQAERFHLRLNIQLTESMQACQHSLLHLPPNCSNVCQTSASPQQALIKVLLCSVRINLEFYVLLMANSVTEIFRIRRSNVVLSTIIPLDVPDVRLIRFYASTTATRLQPGEHRSLTSRPSENAARALLAFGINYTFEVSPLRASRSVRAPTCSRRHRLGSACSSHTKAITL